VEFCSTSHPEASIARRESLAPPHLLLGLPLLHQVLFDAEGLEDSGDDGVGEFFDGLGFVVPGGGGGEDSGAGFGEGGEVAEHDDVHRHLAGDENEVSALFQADVGGAGEEVVADAVGDAAGAAHATGDDDHAVVAEGAGGGRGEVVFGVQEFDLRVVLAKPVLGREILPFGSDAEFSGSDLDGLLAEDQIDLIPVLGGLDEEALGIDRPAGAGDPYY